MWAVGDGIPVDRIALDGYISRAIDEVVKKQVDAGVTIINDGEMSKPSYGTYVKDRLSGFAGESIQTYFFEDLVDFPRSAEAVAGNPGRRKRSAPACTGPIDVVDREAAVKDMTELRRAATANNHKDIFTSAASPGVVSIFFGNNFYSTHEEYVFAIAEAMRFEYEAIAAAGATVQIDCPDLAMGRHSAYATLDLNEFRAAIRTNIEALNHAVRNILLNNYVCIYVGETTLGLIITTFQLLTSWILSGPPNLRQCYLRVLIRAILTNGEYSKNSAYLKTNLFARVSLNLSQIILSTQKLSPTGLSDGAK